MSDERRDVGAASRGSEAGGRTEVPAPVAAEAADVADEAAAVAEAAPDDVTNDSTASGAPIEDDATRAMRERDEFLDTLRRLQADFENYKKRVERQFDELASRAATALVAALLPVLDALDLAEDHLLAEEDGHGALGVEAKALVQARALLLDTLGKEGLARVGSAGDAFDPNLHEAVAHVDGDDGPVIDEVLRAGYRWRSQVLRPAMVKVRG